MKPLFLHGHSRPLTCVTFNRDGDFLFTAGKDSMVAVWHASTGELLGTYDCGKGVVWNCDCSLDSKELLCASADQKVVIFDVDSGALKHEIKEMGPCKFAEWCRKPTKQNKFVVAHDSFGQSSSKAIKMYQVDKDKVTNIWIANDFATRTISVHWGPFDETIISCHDDGMVMVWDAATGEYIKEIRIHKQCITGTSFNDDRTVMLTCCSDGTAKLSNTTNFNILKTYTTDRPLNSCSISPLFKLKPEEQQKCHVLMGGGQAAEDVTTTASGEGKFQALIYHLIHAEEVGCCKGHFGPINTLEWMPNGAGYVSGGEDGFVRIYHFDDDYFTDEKYE